MKNKERDKLREWHLHTKSEIDKQYSSETENKMVSFHKNDTHIHTCMHKSTNTNTHTHTHTHTHTLVCLCHTKQNDLTYLGRVCTPCLSVSTGIYAHTYTQSHTRTHAVKDQRTKGYFARVSFWIIMWC